MFFDSILTPHNHKYTQIFINVSITYFLNHKCSFRKRTKIKAPSIFFFRNKNKRNSPLSYGHIVCFAEYIRKWKFYSSPIFATQKPLHFGSFFYEKSYNKRIRDSETLQVSPSKFLATPKTSLIPDVIFNLSLANL